MGIVNLGVVLTPELSTRLQRVLITQVGDHRFCPSCGDCFIPNDDQAKEALALYRMIYGKLQKGAKR